jgi:N-acetylgalactosamine-6-sulfatase
VVPAGKVDRTSVLTAVDLLPTFLEVAGVDLPVSYQGDGESVWSALKGNSFERTKPIFWEWRGPKVQDGTWPELGVRDGKWKMLVNTEMGRFELYDIESDWAEKKDLSKRNPEIVQRLTRKLNAWKKSLPKKADPDTCSSGRSRKK